MAKTRKVLGARPSTPSSPVNTTRSFLPSPDEVNRPSDDFHDYAACIYGKKGVGKTTLASQFPDSVAFMFERGRRNLPIRQVPRRLPDGKSEPRLIWDTMESKSGQDIPGIPFRQALLEALRDDTIRTITIDTADRCYESALTFCCWQEGVTYPKGDGSYAIWNRIKEEFEEAIGVIKDAGKQVILLSHSREKEVPTELGESFNMVQPTMTPAAWKLVQTQCDLVFYYDYYQGRRALRVQGDEFIWASNQVPGHFLDPEGNPLITIDMGTTPSQSYDNLLKAWNNDIHDITWKPENPNRTRVTRS